MIQNITVRVPWTDNGWCGKVCNNPGENTSCLRLKNIYENKNDEVEKRIAGEDICNHIDELPCIAEGISFMSPNPIIRKVNHPYIESSPDTHSHFLPTEQTFPAYSLPGRPYLWTMLNHGFDYEKLGINYRQELEDSLNLNFSTNWIQTAENQTEIFKRFYKDVVPKKSLCFAYTKQIPYSDKNKRVVIGIGFVNEIIPTKEYNHTDEKSARSLLWETMICHSIREDNKNGFILPYDKISKYAESDPDFDMDQAIIFASDEYRMEFSYATEHLSYDGTIDTLLRAIKVLEYIDGKIKGNWKACITWCKQRLQEVWIDRGAYPGFGEMLCALGLRKGLFIADILNEKILSKKLSFQECINSIFSGSDKLLPNELKETITQEHIDLWKNLSEERKNLFELLSRLSINENQGRVLYFPEERSRKYIQCTDKEILENPYLLFEKTLDKEESIRVSFRKIDMAVFPCEYLQKEFPLSTPTKLGSSEDKRRIRAILIDYLEQQTLNGHSLYPFWLCIAGIKNAAIEPACNVNSDIIKGCLDFLKEELTIVEIESKSEEYHYQNALQLNRLRKIDVLIMETVPKRMNKRNIVQPENWDSILDIFIPNKSEDEEKEKNARAEKKAILKELLESKLSVLIGGAGTGKTTLLACLCASEQIKRGGGYSLISTYW